MFYLRPGCVLNSRNPAHLAPKAHRWEYHSGCLRGETLWDKYSCIKRDIIKEYTEFMCVCVCICEFLGVVSVLFSAVPAEIRLAEEYDSMSSPNATSGEE